jgi:2-iminoacetate synthase ThiH
MKNSGFKMKGYTYPGTSPMKGKAQMKRDAARTKADEAQDVMGEAFDNQFKPTTKSLSPMVKKSPAKQTGLETVVAEGAKQSLTEVAKKSFVSKLGEKAADAAVTTGVNMIGGVLTKDRKKERRQTNTPTMNQSFGSTNIS